MADPKQTPLTQSHIQLGAQMVDFAGWYMPVRYEGIRAEHLGVRKTGGLFDVSHMGEIWIRGEKALETTQWVTTNDVARLRVGQAQYSLLPNAKGGVVDDLIVYCVQEKREYLLCVNASNIDKDFKWLQENNKGAEITDESDAWGQIAVQGPLALKLVHQIFDLDSDFPAFSFQRSYFLDDVCLVAKTGYTGEMGVEIFVPKNNTTALWNQLLDRGQPLNVKPIGLGARDTLRLEMAYCLYGHELDEQTNPYEARLGWVIKPKKKDFVGKEAMLSGKESGLKRKLVGFKMQDKGIPRQGYRLISFDNQEIGTVTSGTLSPSLNEPIGVGYVESSLSSEGSEFFVDIRGRKAKVLVTKTPFVRPLST